MAHDNLCAQTLRVDLAALRRRGVDQHEIRTALPPSWLAEALRQTDAEVAEAGAVSLRLLLQPEGIVVVQGGLRIAFSVPCGRCLSPAAVDGDAEIFATYMPSAAAARFAQDDEDDEVEPESSDVWSYDGPSLSLEPMVAEQVALAYPMRALCERSEDCRGLCSNCGYELNTLAPEIRRCPRCHNEVPLTPVAAAGGPGEGDEGPRDDRPTDNPLAAALRGLKID